MRILPINQSSAKALPRILLALAVFFSLTLVSFTSKAADRRKSRGKAKAESSKKSRKETSAKKDRSKRGRENPRSAKNNKRNDRREAARNERNERKKDWRKMSRRERAAELRRAREERRRAEAARRRAIEEARRRELAFLKGLKDEATNNILNDDTTGEDMEVRRAALNALGEKLGTVVVMNPKTGQIYSIVNQGWGIGKGFKPCSIVKLVTSVAGITEGQISVEEEANYSPNRLNLVDALAFSKNGYFQSVGGRVGFDKMKDYAKELGLGEKTGINLPNESTGELPRDKTGYAVNHMSSHGDDFEVTALQIATMVSALGNGGNLLKPRVLRTEQEKARFKPEIRHKLDLSQKTLDDVMPGMAGAVTYGTGKGSQTPGYFIAGKTGTCTGQGTKLGLFGSYGPIGDPQLAVAVITRGPGQKGRVAAAIAGNVYRALSHRFVKPAFVPMARIPMVPRQRANTMLPSDEDATEEDDTSAQNGVQPNNPSNDATMTNVPGTTNNNVQKIGITVPKNVPPQQSVPQQQQQSKPNQTGVKPVVIEVKRSGEQKQTTPSNNTTTDGQRPRIVTEKPKVKTN